MIVPSAQKPVRRLIYPCKQENLDDIRGDLTQFSNEFTGNHSTYSPVDQLWFSFKTKNLNTFQKHVPTKITSQRYSQSFCNRSVKQLPPETDGLLEYQSDKKNP